MLKVEPWKSSLLSLLRSFQATAKSNSPEFPSEHTTPAVFHRCQTCLIVKMVRQNKLSS